MFLFNFQSRIQSRTPPLLQFRFLTAAIFLYAMTELSEYNKSIPCFLLPSRLCFCKVSRNQKRRDIYFPHIYSRFHLIPDSVINMSNSDKRDIVHDDFVLVLPPSMTSWSGSSRRRRLEIVTRECFMYAFETYNDMARKGGVEGASPTLRDAESQTEKEIVKLKIETESQKGGKAGTEVTEQKMKQATKLEDSDSASANKDEKVGKTLVSKKEKQEDETERSDEGQNVNNGDSFSQNCPKGLKEEDECTVDRESETEKINDGTSTVNVKKLNLNEYRKRKNAETILVTDDAIEREKQRSGAIDMNDVTIVNNKIEMDISKAENEKRKNEAKEMSEVVATLKPNIVLPVARSSYDNAKLKDPRLAETTPERTKRRFSSENSQTNQSSAAEYVARHFEQFKVSCGRSRN